MAYVPVDVIEVSAWDRQVGAVALDPSSGFYVFEYSPEWINSPVDLAPTTMPLRAQPYVFPTLPVDTFYRLPALLADALPDAFGNALVEKELTSQGVRPSDIDRAGPPGLPRQARDRRTRVPPHTGTSTDQIHRH